MTLDLIEKVTAVGPASLALLRARVSMQSPGLARSSLALWRSLAAALTVEQVDAVISLGALTAETQAVLTAGVADFAAGPLAERWRSSLRAGSRAVDTSFELLSRERVNDWIRRRSATLIVQQTEQQRAAVRALLSSSAEGDRRVLSAALRATVGLTERQARALATLSNALVEDGAPVERRRAILERAASRAQRIRAQRIARTELASAFNGGVEESIAGALDSGAISGNVVKTWRRQNDERSKCDVCKNLDGDSVALGSTFAGGFETPPAHPNCRCVLLYQVTK